MYEFNIIHRGFSFGVAVSYYNPGKPAQLYGEMEDCQPAEDEEIEFEVLFATVDDEIEVARMLEEGFTIDAEEIEGAVLQAQRDYLS